MPLEGLIGEPVRGKLSALRRRLVAHLLGAGAAWAVVAAVAGVFGTLAVDYLLPGTRLQRGLFLAIALAAVGYVLWRLVLRPLRVPMDSEELALVLEQYYPRLGDRLISALQFSTAPAVPGASESLIRMMARQANALAAEVDSSAPIDARRTYRRLSAGAFAAAVLAAVTVLWPDLIGLWFQRNVLLADVPWPRQTYLSVPGGPLFRVVRGEDLLVAVVADPAHVVPAQVTFRMKFPGLGRVDEMVSPVTPGGNRFEKNFEAVSQGFEFHVKGNDDTTDTCRVTVVDPPEVVAMSFQIRYPDYMGRPQADLTGEHGVLAVPPGSLVTLTGSASKDIASGRLVLDGRSAGDVQTVPAPRGILATVQVPLRPERRSLTLEVVLVDNEGIANSRAGVYSLRIQPDEPPSVSVTRQAVRGDVTARALIPLLIDCRDDCGVAAVKVATEAPGLEEFVSVEPAGTTLPAASTRPASTRPASTQPAKQEFPVRDVPPGQRQVRVVHELDLEPMQLQIGQLLRVQAVAADTLPASYGGPNVEISRPPLSFKIVSDEELLAELVRRQKEVSQDFVRTVALQAAVRDKVRVIDERLNGAAAGAAADPADIQGLETARRDQDRVRAQCVADAERYREVHDEYIYNRVGKAADIRQIAEEIVGPLQDLCKKKMMDVGAALDRASKVKDAAALRRQTGELVNALRDLHDELDAILKKMLRLETRQELANLLKYIIDDSMRMLTEIRDLKRGETEKILKPATRPGR